MIQFIGQIFFTIVSIEPYFAYLKYCLTKDWVFPDIDMESFVLLTC